MRVKHYDGYRPLLLDEALTVERLKCDDYRAFVLGACIEPGVRLIVLRDAKNANWPYVDTKFNPGLGADLAPESYHIVHSWFLGRGSQALDGHLPWLDKLEGLDGVERSEAGSVFGRLVATMTEAIEVMMARNNGRCPFRTNLRLKEIDEAGREIESDTKQAGAGDLFCAKGLIASGRKPMIELGVKALLDAAAKIRAGSYGHDQFKEQPKELGHGPKMLFQDAVSLLYAKSDDARLRGQIADVATEFLAFVLDKHCDPQTGVFSEYIDYKTHARGTQLDPGHCNEFVGLGLGAIATVEAGQPAPDAGRRKLLARAKAEMPRLLIRSTRFGYNPAHPGMYKLLDTATGKPINPEMPWWNLPETLRAVVRCLQVSDDGATRAELLELYRLCHNAYFANYLNRGNMLFPFQTISGLTGKVIDVAPAVPEGDPLYHTNLAMLETLEVIEAL
ncbi:MAG: hypothetical protein BIFFINMI_00361 [Phycisphaerae bacterium]|nr:hypothetical protein [Phycisphaerae bacterium]